MEVLERTRAPQTAGGFPVRRSSTTYRVRHPWARDHDVHPKSIVRDMYERSMSFAEYVAYYGLTRSEGVLLRYLSDAYKALVQNVPEDLKSTTLRDLSEWLGEMVRQVDSSLLDEWELLSHPEEFEAALARGARPTTSAAPGKEPPPLTSNGRAFKVMVRNACFRRVELAAKRDWAALGEMDQATGWDAHRWEAAFAPYFADHGSIGTGPAARGPTLWQVDEQGRRWRVRQVLDDPAGYHEWAMVLDVDLDASDQRGEPALQPIGRRAGIATRGSARPGRASAWGLRGPPANLLNHGHATPRARRGPPAPVRPRDRSLPYRGAHLPGQTATAPILAHGPGRLFHADRPDRGRSHAEARYHLRSHQCVCWEPSWRRPLWR